MGRISSSIGLITGLPIQDLVTQLLQIDGRSRDLVQSQQTLAAAKESALNELADLTLGVDFSVARLGESDLFQSRKVTSSNPSALAALVVGAPSQGSFQYTPIRSVQSQQFLSSGYSSPTAPVGSGTLTFRHGPDLEEGLDLKLLNGGQGFSRGKIRITDRSGANAVVDLSKAVTIDDVLEAINSQTAINVTAVAKGDGLQLIDNTGQTTSNLKVQEVGGTTAASLGLAGIDAASATANGQDIVRLVSGFDLAVLNDGHGVRGTASGTNDLKFTFRDGTTKSADFNPGDHKTLGDVVAWLNTLDPTRLNAEIAPDGDRLLLTDLSTDTGGAFAVEALGGSQLARDLGLTTTSSGDTLSGARLLGGTRGPLLRNLDGGDLGALGSIDLTDRSGATASVDLSSAETLNDVLEAVNSAGLGLKASANAARNGILLTDTTGASASNLIVASADATNSAEALGIAVNAAQSSVNSGDLHLRIISENTQLDRLNGGAGIGRGVIRIVNSLGATRTLNLANTQIRTVGEVADAINALGISVTARINDTGDGLALVDTAGGAGRLTVSDSSGTSAVDLHIAGTAVDAEIEGDPVQVIDGTTTYTVNVAADDTLEDLISNINNLKAGVTASLFNDGSPVNPYRFSLLSQRSGKAGGLVIDTSQAGFALEETVPPADALLVFGAGSSGILVSSSKNTFNDVLPGVQLTVTGASETPVTISVGASDEQLLADAKTFVDDYNKLMKRLKDLTLFDTSTNKRSILTGESVALRIESDLNTLASGRILGAGTIRSLEEVGVGFDDSGNLTLDSDKLGQAFADDPEAVQEFFTKKDAGVVDRFRTALKRLVGEDTSLLSIKIDALEEQLEQYTDRIAYLNGLLETKRQRYLNQFNGAEIAIGKLQANLAALNALQPIPPLGSS